MIGAYYDTVAGEITRYERHIAKFMGDGILAYLGWPRAHEGVAERAAHASLTIAQVRDGEGQVVVLSG
jgi:class 3 adenylate cyclase